MQESYSDDGKRYVVDIDVPNGVWASEFMFDLNDYLHMCGLQNPIGWDDVVRRTFENLSGNLDMLADANKRITLTFQLSNQHDAGLIEQLTR